VVLYVCGTQICESGGMGLYGFCICGVGTRRILAFLEGVVCIGFDKGDVERVLLLVSRVWVRIVL